MSYNFPNTPAEDQEFTPAGGATYVYKAPHWQVKSVNYLPLAGGTLTGTLTISSAGVLVLQSTTASSSPTTGALTVAGGVGIGGALFAEGATFKNASNVTVLTVGDTYSTTNGLHGITIQTYSNGDGYFDVKTATSGSLYFRGGAGAEPGYQRTLLQIQSTTGNTTIYSTTASTSPTTGALTVAGGAGINGNLYCKDLHIDRDGSVAAIYFNQTAANYLVYDGTGYVFQGGPVKVNGNISMDVAAGPLLSFYKSGVLQSMIGDTGGAVIVYSNAAASAGMYIAHGASAWTAVSDDRLPYKKTARSLSALDKLEHIVLYENEVDGKLELFGKAQELFRAFPHVVDQGDDDPAHIQKAWGVSYDRLGLVALQAVKELLVQVNKLQERIAVLEAKQREVY